MKRAADFCPGHSYRVLLIDGWCGVCTARNEIRAQAYQHECYCPRCLHKDAHAWDGMSYLDEQGRPVQQMRIIRKCNFCKFRWRQW